jgi:hypothetical protein
MTALPLRMRRKIRFEVTEYGMCWTWTGCVNSKGYGCVGLDGKTQLTHRVAYTLCRGPIPEGLQIDHLCRNVRCCNPCHLEPVTGAVNMSRTPQAMRTHCARANHALIGDNLIVKKRGALPPVRNCRACVNERKRDRRAAEAVSA